MLEPGSWAGGPEGDQILLPDFFECATAAVTLSGFGLRSNLNCASSQEPKASGAARFGVRQLDGGLQIDATTKRFAGHSAKRQFSYDRVFAVDVIYK
jgi:hypothetical protein